MAMSLKMIETCPRFGSGVHFSAPEKRIYFAGARIFMMSDAPLAGEQSR
jgi:hypothetical protein